jgi:hypothetical protein
MTLQMHASEHPAARIRLPLLVLLLLVCGLSASRSLAGVSLFVCECRGARV